MPHVQPCIRRNSSPSVALPVKPSAAQHNANSQRRNWHVYAHGQIKLETVPRRIDGNGVPFNSHNPPFGVKGNYSLTMAPELEWPILDYEERPWTPQSSVSRTELRLSRGLYRAAVPLAIAGTELVLPGE